MTDLTRLISEAGRMLDEDRPSTSDDPLRAGQVLWNALVCMASVRILLTLFGTRMRTRITRMRTSPHSLHD